MVEVGRSKANLNREEPMRDILHDLYRAGLGLTKLTREDIGKAFNELKNRGEVEEEDREYFISRTLEKLEKAGKDLSKKVAETLNPNIEKIEELNAKVDELIKEINALKKSKS
jgi:polyhydroxyalkanoate synthesis regulator phasin